MRIAVVTPYYQEPLAKLQRCHDSVRQQTHAQVTHIMVADGFARPEVQGWDCQHIALPVGHRDSGDTPRTVGCASAASQQFDAIALLDADNWFEPGHLAAMAHVQKQAGVQVVTCARNLVRPDDGRLIGVCRESDGVHFNDTNCYLVTDAAFGLFAAWGFRHKQLTRSLGCLGDRLFWNAIVQSKVTRAHATVPTVNYETAWASHYVAHGHPIPAFAKVNVWLAKEQRNSLVAYQEYLRLLAAGEVADAGLQSE